MRWLCCLSSHRHHRLYHVVVVVVVVDAMTVDLNAIVFFLVFKYTTFIWQDIFLSFISFSCCCCFFFFGVVRSFHGYFSLALGSWLAGWLICVFFYSIIFHFAHTRAHNFLRFTFSVFISLCVLF